jgi:hypothetical protein
MVSLPNRHISGTENRIDKRFVRAVARILVMGLFGEGQNTTFGNYLAKVCMKNTFFSDASRRHPYMNLPVL